MNTVNVALMGYGRVGKAFVRLVQRKKEDLVERYGFRLEPVAVFNSRGGVLLPGGAPSKKPLIDKDDDLDLERNPFWKPGRICGEVFEAHRTGVFVECTPSNIQDGEPALRYINHAIDRGWHVVTANKGPLVVDLNRVRQKAEKKGVRLGMSGATAAALPTLDVALNSLAGTEIHRIEGILNGTTNYILGRIEEGMSYEAALKEAQEKGIAEPDPSQDVEGWDTAAKILIITNAVFRTAYTLDDVRVEGITHIQPSLWERARNESKSLKLLGSYCRDEGIPKIEARLCFLEHTHPLYAVCGAQKGITFFTDTMNSVTVTGGKSDPTGAAAALLKDIINIHKR